MASTDLQSAAADTDAAKPLVSMIVANYNMGRFVAETIRSLCAQTVTDVEIVVVDDGSTDDSWDVIQREAALDRRIVTLRQANAGQASAKNAGIRASRGQFVGFCDADDLWKPNKLEVQLKAFTSQDIGVVYTDADHMNEKGEYLGSSDMKSVNGWVLEKMFVRNFVPFGTALIRRDALVECGVFDERYRMGIDWELWLRIARKYQFVHVREWTMQYRLWSGQMSKNWRGRYDWVLRIMGDFLAKYPNELDKDIVRRAWGHTYFNRGSHRADMGGERVRGTLDVIRGLRYCPEDFSGWKLLVKIWIAPFRRSK